MGEGLRMRWLRLILQILVILLFSCGAVSPGEHTRRDGNWWVAESDLSKSTYVLGMFDGTTLGRDFAVRKYSQKYEDYAKLSNETTTILNAFTETEQLLMSNVTVGQVVAGLDDFYKDYKNRKIESVYAVEVVLEGAAGMSKTDLDKWVEGLRQMASKY
jgi:hypothetical protein